MALRPRQSHRQGPAPGHGGAGVRPKQAELAQRILPLLTEEEQAVFRRGRNANVHSIPAHASRAQYQQATALEALLGWLHLSGRHDRVEQLFAVMMEEE